MVHHKEWITSSNVTDSSITLNFDNLEALCFNCHQKETFSKEKEYIFNSDGDLVKNPKYQEEKE